MKRGILLSAVLGLLVLPGVARAVEVNDPADSSDSASLGASIAACTAGLPTGCTLRGATQLAALPVAITFSSTLPGAIALSSPVSVPAGTTIDGGPSRPTITAPNGAFLMAGANSAVKNLDIAANAAASAITVSGTGSMISGTFIRNGGTGIDIARGSAAIAGNTVQGNGVGILVRGGGASITANNVIANGDGIRVIGGIAIIGSSMITAGPASAENLINANAGDGIESVPPGATRLLRNRGTNGAGSLFFDVGRNGLGGGPTRPTIFGASATAINGRAAPNSWVRVYKATGDRRGLDSFLGLARATARTGRWALSYASALPANTPVAANRSAFNGANPSEFAFGVVDTTPPDTQITSGPPGLTNDPTRSFRFGSGDPTATFQCKFDGADYARCTSPRMLVGLADGKHRFSVRAVDPAGNVDPTPAVRTLTLDTDVPIVSLSRTARVVKRQLKVTVTCARGKHSCRGKLLLRRGKTRLKSVSFLLKPRKGRTVPFRLSTKTARAIMRARRPSITVVAKTSDKAGNTATLTRRLRLR